MNNREVLEQVLQAFCEETELNPTDLTAETEILELDLDSVDYMKVMLSVEARLGFEFQNEDLNLEGYGTISQFAGFVADHYLNGDGAQPAGQSVRDEN